MGAECNGCGQCCLVVALPYTKRQVARMDPDAPELAGGVRDWVLNDLTRLRPEEVQERAPWQRLDTRMMTPRGVAGKPIFYRCRHHDEATGLCRNHEHRPATCRGYPWFGRPPNPAGQLPSSCAYREDIGQPVILLPTRRMVRP